MVVRRRSKRADEKASNERTPKLGTLDLAPDLESRTPVISPSPKRLKASPLSTSPRRSSRLKSVNPVDYSSNNFWTKSVYDAEKGKSSDHCSELENEKAMVVWRQNEREYEKGSNYEELREQRIKENNERMKKLGIVDLALKLQSPTPTTSPNPRHLKASPLSTSPRHSSRLKNVNPVNKSSKNITKPEHDPEKGQMCHPVRESENEKAMVVSSQRKRADEKGYKYEEIRRQRIKENNERMKTLGIFYLAHKLQSPTPKTSPKPKRPKSFPLSTSPRRSLRLKSVNVMNDLGESVHYPVAERAQKCHQCGKKSLGPHSHCSNCKLIQGLFCGDCLKMSYGEDLLEDYGNARWVCPVCRGICSCNHCRKKKGLAITFI